MKQGDLRWNHDASLSFGFRDIVVGVLRGDVDHGRYFDIADPLPAKSLDVLVEHSPIRNKYSHDHSHYKVLLGSNIGHKNRNEQFFSSAFLPMNAGLRRD